MKNTLDKKRFYRIIRSKIRFYQLRTENEKKVFDNKTLLLYN